MSAQTKWTPGPWQTIKAQRGFIVAAHDNTYDIAVVRDIGNENNEANATLIATAPELYEACSVDGNIEPLLLAANVLRKKGYDQLADILTHKHYREVAALKKARGE